MSFQMTKEIALCIKTLRVEFDCTWRRIAGIITDEKDSSQPRGMSICSAASKFLGENWD